jgi:hypothetical protein
VQIMSELPTETPSVWETSASHFQRWHALVAGGAAPADALAEVSAAADDVVPLLSFGAGW